MQDIRNIKNIGEKNKNKIYEILNKISYTVDFESIEIENGYFLFEFDKNSVAHFSIKEFPEWKFGIWLYKNGEYSVFGEAITLIDKFKPSRSSLSCNNIEDFNKELDKIMYNEDDWKEYNKRIEWSLERDRLSKEYNKRVYKKINQYVENTQKEFEEGKVKSFLKLVDRNNELFDVCPRYRINEYIDNKNYAKTTESAERTKQMFKDLCNLLEPTFIKYNDFDDEICLDVDEYLFENLTLMRPDECKRIRLESFDNYIKNLAL